MTTLTTAEVLQLSRDKLLELAETVLPTTKLLKYANLCQDDIAKDVLTDDITIPTTLSFSGGAATLPSNWESHRLSKDSQVPGQGNEFKYVNLEDYRAGKYERMITKYNGQILVFPVDTSVLYTDYYKKLPDMAIDPVQNPSVDVSLQELIIYGIMFRALEDLQDFELAKEYRGKFEQELKLKSRKISLSEEGPEKSGEMFNYVQIV